MYVDFRIRENPHNQSLERVFSRAVSYWNNRGNQYSTYPVHFVHVYGDHDPDVIVEFVDEIDTCSGEEDIDRVVGCAPMLSEPNSVRSPVTARIEIGYTQNAMTNTTIHELGHILGLKHGDEPASLMAAEAAVPELSQPDAVNLTNPWMKTNLTYYVPSSASPRARSQIDHGFRYIQRSGDGAVTVDYQFTEVAEPEDADIVLSFSDSDNWVCPSDYPSCGTPWGVSPDNDRRLEQYTYYELEFAESLDEDAIAWHTAFWMFYATNSLENGDPPDKFLDFDYEERRSGWWTD